ncbi:hypothetical protein CXF67_13975 [Psychroflexus sp. MES1-P1E]|nr:hypothetical protein CXF67_13975 [Psychroflexus sp. MES1-P1E]
MKSKLFFYLIISSVITSSCTFFGKEENTTNVARVNNHYLYRKELSEHISNNLSKIDSTVAARNYIQNWARDKLFLDRAKLNLPQEQQSYFRDLSKKYEEQLFKKAYKDALIEKQLKVQIDSSEIALYYQDNKSNFKLNEDLVQLKYLQLDKKMKSLRDIKREFVRFNAEDMLSLQEKSLEFKSLSLNDSIWVRVSDVVKEFEENKGIQLEKSEISKVNSFLEFENESDVFYFYTKDFLKRNDQAPLSYVRPTIEQILLNKKKINISKIIDKEITKDATKNNEFEVY